MTAPSDGPQTTMVNGKSRAYIIRPPKPYDTNRPYPLVFAFHVLATESDADHARPVRDVSGVPRRCAGGLVPPSGDGLQRHGTRLAAVGHCGNGSPVHGALSDYGCAD